MTCRSLGPTLVDLARGVVLDDARRSQVERHLEACAACSARLEQQRALSAALGRLARELEPAPPDPARERRLLRTFEEAWSADGVRSRLSARRVRRSGQWAARAAFPLAATLVLAASWMLGRHSQNNSSVEPAAGVDVRLPDAPVARPQTSATRPERARRRPLRPAPADVAAAAEFIAWPGVEGWPRIESGELVRVHLPVSALPGLGVWPPPSDVAVVTADILVGQDGFARAVRLVQ